MKDLKNLTTIETDKLHVIISDLVLPCADESEVYNRHLIDPNTTVWTVSNESVEGLMLNKEQPWIHNYFGTFVGVNIKEKDYDYDRFQTIGCTKSTNSA